jgi:hypothetical protein
MPLEYGQPYPNTCTYFFLAAFTGFFAFVLVFLTIPNIKYVLLIYKYTTVG